MQDQETRALHARFHGEIIDPATMALVAHHHGRDNSPGDFSD